MQAIKPPTPDEVSKLRKAAKLLVRKRQAPTHAQALDDTARAAGFNHWKHVLDLASSAATHYPSARAYFHATSISPPKQQDFTIIEGRSGSGKSLRATQVVLDWLRDQMPVCLFDSGRSFDKFVQTIGGTRIEYDAEGTPTTTVFGSTALTLFEFENMRPQPGPPQYVWNKLPESIWALEQTLLVIDEVYFVDRLYQNLPALLEGHLDLGGSLMVLMQDAKDSAMWARFAAIKTDAKVARRRIVLDRL